MKRGCESAGMIVLVTCCCGAPVHAQFEGGLVGVDTDGESYFETAGPQTIPGREKGARSQGTTVERDEAPPASEPGEREWFGVNGAMPWHTWSRATGDWGGVRTRLEEAGLTLSLSYTFEWSSVWEGGVARRASTRSLFDANALFDLAPSLGWGGGSIFIDFQSTDGRGGASDVGVFQGFSNVETAELWFEQVFADGMARLKVGKVDANSEFAFVNSAEEFINPSAGFSPTIFTLPTYPDPSTSINFFIYPTEWLYAGVGAYDGSGSEGIRTGGRGPASVFDGDDYMYLGEIGATWQGVHGGRDEGATAHAGFGFGVGRVAVGGWGHSGEFQRFDGGTDNGTGGVFAMVEQQLSQRDGAPTGEGGLFVFAQFGWADENVSEAGMHIAGGITLLGTFGDRDDDATGLYVSFVDLSDEDGAGFVEDEVVMEVFYKAAITPFLALRGDVQYIVHPGGSDGSGGSADDALVGTIRVEATF
jgi:porin